MNRLGAPKVVVPPVIIYLSDSSDSSNSDDSKVTKALPARKPPLKPGNVQREITQLQQQADARALEIKRRAKSSTKGGGALAPAELRAMEHELSMLKARIALKEQERVLNRRALEKPAVEPSVEPPKLNQTPDPIEALRAQAIATMSRPDRLRPRASDYFANSEETISCSSPATVISNGDDRISLDMDVDSDASLNVDEATLDSSALNKAVYRLRGAVESEEVEVAELRKMKGLLEEHVVQCTEKKRQLTSFVEQLQTIVSEIAQQEDLITSDLELLTRDITLRQQLIRKHRVLLDKGLSHLDEPSTQGPRVDSGPHPGLSALRAAVIASTKRKRADRSPSPPQERPRKKPIQDATPKDRSSSPSQERLCKTPVQYTAPDVGIHIQKSAAGADARQSSDARQISHAVTASIPDTKTSNARQASGVVTASTPDAKASGAANNEPSVSTSATPPSSSLPVSSPPTTTSTIPELKGPSSKPVLADKGTTNTSKPVSEEPPPPSHADASNTTVPPAVPASSARPSFKKTSQIPSTSSDQPTSLAHVSRNDANNETVLAALSTPVEYAGCTCGFAAVNICRIVRPGDYHAQISTRWPDAATLRTVESTTLPLCCIRQDTDNASDILTWWYPLSSSVADYILRFSQPSSDPTTAVSDTELESTDAEILGSGQHAKAMDSSLSPSNGSDLNAGASPVPHWLRPQSSPLSCLRSYRVREKPTGAFSLSVDDLMSTKWSHKIDSGGMLCRFSIHGTCSDKNCPWQHASDYQLSDLEMVKDVLFYALGSDTRTVDQLAAKLLAKHKNVVQAVEEARSMVGARDLTESRRSRIRQRRRQVLDTAPEEKDGSNDEKPTRRRNPGHRDTPAASKPPLEETEDLIPLQGPLPETIKSLETSDNRYYDDVGGSTQPRRGRRLLETVGTLITNFRQGQAGALDEALKTLARALEEDTEDTFLWLIYLRLLQCRPLVLVQYHSVCRHAATKGPLSYELWMRYIECAPSVETSVERFDQAISAFLARDPSRLLREDIIFDFLLQRTHAYCQAKNASMAVRSLREALETGVGTHQDSKFELSRRLRAVGWICLVHIAVTSEVPLLHRQSFGFTIKPTFLVNWPRAIYGSEPQESDGQTFIDACEELLQAAVTDTYDDPAVVLNWAMFQVVLWDSRPMATRVSISQISELLRAKLLRGGWTDQQIRAFLLEVGVSPQPSDPSSLLSLVSSGDTAPAEIAAMLFSRTYVAVQALLNMKQVQPAIQVLCEAVAPNAQPAEVRVDDAKKVYRLGLGVDTHAEAPSANIRSTVSSLRSKRRNDGHLWLCYATLEALTAQLVFDLERVAEVLEHASAVVRLPVWRHRLAYESLLVRLTLWRQHGTVVSQLRRGVWRNLKDFDVTSQERLEALPKTTFALEPTPPRRTLHCDARNHFLAFMLQSWRGGRRLSALSDYADLYPDNVPLLLCAATGASSASQPRSDSEHAASETNEGDGDGARMVDDRFGGRARARELVLCAAKTAASEVDLWLRAKSMYASDAASTQRFDTVRTALNNCPFLPAHYKAAFHAPSPQPAR